MIGIVIVSHSAALAAGVHELAAQMTGDRVPMAVAGGSSNEDDPIGTDPMLVLEAISAVDQGDPILVLMDLGSAIMSAEAALDFLDDDVRARIYLCEAPLIEGAIAAAVQAAAGSPVQRVLAEARSALQAKSDQLAPLLRDAPPADRPASAASVPAGSSQSITISIPNRLGLHARPAARLVELAARRRVAVTYSCKGRTAAGDSINQIATLGARQGDSLTVQVMGPDAAEFLEAFTALAESNFGDTEEMPSSTPVQVEQPQTGEENGASRVTGAYKGQAVSPGIAVGPAVRLRRTMPAIAPVLVDDPGAEGARLEAALSAAAADLDVVRHRRGSALGAEGDGILAAQRLILRDPALVDLAHEAIAAQHICAEAAWSNAIQSTVAAYQALDDPYLRERADDVQEVGRRVLGHLMDITPDLHLDEPAIVVARNLGPLDVAQMDAEQILGVVTAAGGGVGHAAILLRSLGIPAVMGVGPALNRIQQGAQIALDGGRGLVWPAPDAATQASLQEERRAQQAAHGQAVARAAQPAVTRDGRAMRVAANIGGSAEARVAVEQGAEEVGLFRSEFLFQLHAAAPDEEAQLAAYSATAQALGGRRLVVRTLDAGADKPVPSLPMESEENPFLGRRGIRFSLAQPELMQTQLRAILRSAVHYPVAVLFPMISTLEELTAARRALQEAEQALATAGLATGTVQVGVMIETPAAVSLAPELAGQVDFFSIGTNDLTQYLMAADRNNPQVAGLISPLQPALVRAVAAVAQAAHSAQIPVAICGEAAGDPHLAALWIGLGIDELSMSPPAIPRVKDAIRAVDSSRAQQLAQTVLTLTSEQAIRDAIERFATRRSEP